MRLGVMLPLTDIGGEPSVLREFAQAGMEISAPMAPSSAVPAMTEPKATAGWMSTVFDVSLGCTM